MSRVNQADIEDIHIMSADNRSMTVIPKIDTGGDLMIEILPRIRYRIKTSQKISIASFFSSGVLLVPEPDGEYTIAINLSDRMAIAKLIAD
jgi:hypothetical protein